MNITSQSPGYPNIRLYKLKIFYSDTLTRRTVELSVGEVDKYLSFG